MNALQLLCGYSLQHSLSQEVQGGCSTTLKANQTTETKTPESSAINSKVLQTPYPLLICIIDKLDSSPPNKKTYTFKQLQRFLGFIYIQTMLPYIQKDFKTTSMFETLTKKS